MLKKEMDMIERINKLLTALVEGDLSSKRLPKDLGEFEETFSLLAQANNSLKGMTEQANQIATGNYTADISPRSDKDELGIAMQKMTATLRDVGNIAEVIATGAILDAKVEIKGKDDLLGNSMNMMIEMIKEVARQVDMLAQGDYRADISPRGDKDVIGIAMQAMTLTLRQASKVVESVATGNLDIAIDVKGEQDMLANSINSMIIALKGMTEQANQIATGNYTADISPRSDKDELGIAMQKMTATLRDVGNIAEVIATGAILDAKVEIKGKDDLLGNSMNMMIEMIKEVARQVDMLAQGDYRADISPRGDKDVIGIAMQAMTLTLRQASKVVESVATGNLDIAIDVKGEQDMLANSINSMIIALKGMTEQANQIATGNYTADISPRSDKDELGIALQKMTATLREVGKVTEAVANGNYDLQVAIKGEQDLLAKSVNRMTTTIGKAITENKKQDWLKTGQNELNDKMRGDQDETILARNIITHLAKYLGAQIGALYVTEAEGDDLKLVGSYAFSKRKNLNERIKIGEGLVGQAAYEKELISVTNIPEDYSRIGSAIGDAIPRNVVVSPFMMDNQLSGVIEFGAFKEFSDAEMELLNTTMENIAVNFTTAKANAKMKFLLEETQRQTEELESQQEELRQSNESLESQSDNLRHANQDLETQKIEIEHKNMEVEEKVEELAISSKYKSEFLANMSHELRTPLNSLLLLSGSLAKNKEGNLNEEQVQSASVIHSGGNDLLNLINEILDLSKIEAGMMDVEFKAIRLQEVADRLERDFKHMCEDKGLELKIQLAPNLPTIVSTDQNRLGQILKNLMSNAIKFTKKGSIIVGFGNPANDVNLFRSGLEPKNAFAIAIMDTGIGIPEEKKKVIFEAFQQAEGGTAREYGGTGLGLSISRELATLLGGEIQLKSQLGEGSTFTLYLPLDWEGTKAQRHRGGW